MLQELVTQCNKFSNRYDKNEPKIYIVKTMAK